MADIERAGSVFLDEFALHHTREPGGPLFDGGGLLLNSVVVGGRSEPGGVPGVLTGHVGRP